MNVWFSSDHHFNHSNILTFTGHDGNLIRPGFSSVEEMNETMIERHNQLVKPTDKWYCLGDIGFSKPGLELILPRLNGKRRLILGNHDQYDMKLYMRFFQKIMVSWRPLRSLIFSHYPLYIGQNDPKLRANVHGHIHKGQIFDPKYLNISVEETDYRPLHFDEIEYIFKARGIEL